MGLKEKAKKLYESETLRYLFIGGCTTFVNIAVFWLLADLLLWETTISNVISVILSILFAYVTNKIFVFQAKTNGVKETFIEMCKFVGARLSTMVIEVGGVYLLYNIIGQWKMAAKLETQILVIIGNYFISKFFVFKQNN